MQARQGAGGSWQANPGLPATSGWGWSRIERGQIADYQPLAGHAGVIELGNETGQARPISGGGGLEPVVLRFAANPASGPIPAIANVALLEATGARKSDTILVSRVGNKSRVKIVDVVPMFPTLEPTKTLPRRRRPRPCPPRLRGLRHPLFPE